VRTLFVVAGRDGPSQQIGWDAAMALSQEATDLGVDRVTEARSCPGPHCKKDQYPKVYEKISDGYVLLAQSDDLAYTTDQINARIRD
jgi:hypothetical protein